MGVSGQRHAPAALLPPRKGPRYPLYRRLGLDTEARGKILYPRRGSNPYRPIYCSGHAQIICTCDGMRIQEMRIEFVFETCRKAGSLTPTLRHRLRMVSSGVLLLSLVSYSRLANSRQSSSPCGYVTTGAPFRELHCVVMEMPHRSQCSPNRLSSSVPEI
jgi:hypothetical protein